MTKALSTNGLILPIDFPVTPYETVHSIVSPKLSANPLYEHFSGAWNAIAYRFASFAKAGDSFTVSVKAHGAAPQPEQRYLQEEALYNFFTSGFSIFESCCYALFALGAHLQPAHFPLATSKEQQQVSPARTREAFQKAFKDDAIVLALSTLFADTAYQGLREIRNVLTHRTAPGRRIYASLGPDDAPPTEWKLNNIILDATLAPRWRKDIVRMLDQVESAIAVFASNKL